MLTPLEHAKQLLARTPPDPNLAVYVLRDSQEVKDKNLLDLVWAMHKDGYVSIRDVEFVIELIEREEQDD